MTFGWCLVIALTTLACEAMVGIVVLALSLIFSKVMEGRALAARDSEEVLKNSLSAVGAIIAKANEDTLNEMRVMMEELRPKLRQEPAPLVMPA